MHSVSSLALRTGGYEIVPSEEMSECAQQLRKAISGGEHHLYNIVRENGTRELEIIRRTTPQGDTGDLLRSVDTEFLFRPPSGDPLLALSPGGLTSPYTLRDATSDEVLATWRKSFYVVGDWTVRDSAEVVQATVRKTQSIRTLLSSSRVGAYAMYSADGTEIAQFDHFRVDPNPLDTTSFGLELSLELSQLPPEVVIAIAYGLFHDDPHSEDW